MSIKTSELYSETIANITEIDKSEKNSKTDGKIENLPVMLK